MSVTRNSHSNLMIPVAVANILSNVHVSIPSGCQLCTAESHAPGAVTLESNVIACKFCARGQPWHHASNNAQALLGNGQRGVTP